MGGFHMSEACGTPLNHIGLKRWLKPFCSGFQRHHCRACGMLVCSKHIDNDVTMSDGNNHKTCNECYSVIIAIPMYYFSDQWDKEWLDYLVKRRKRCGRRTSDDPKIPKQLFTYYCSQIQDLSCKFNELPI